MNKTVLLVLCILVTVSIGFIGGLFTAGNVNGWYTTIRRPSWNPPNSVFGPVWTLLYVLMGVAIFLVIKDKPFDSIRKTAVIFFAIQLILNFCWSIIFFAKHQPGLAFGEIVILWIFILLTIFAFARINTTAAWLLVPYISWVSFAAILNFSIWQLNKP